MFTNKISEKNYTHQCPNCGYKIKLKQTDKAKQICPGCKKLVILKKVK